MELSSNQVLYRKEGGIAHITFNRPEADNTISRKLFLALVEAVDDAARDSSVRVVIFDAVGDHFCAGFDVGDPDASLNAGDEPVDFMFRRENTQEEVDLWMKILNLRKPTIGALKGRVLGGGCLLALCMDCLIVAENTTMDNMEFALGMGYTIYLPFDAWKIPMNVAKKKAFTGEPITAEEGYRFGFFNDVVPIEKLDAAAERLAHQMLRLSPYTLTAHKEIYNLAYTLQGMQAIVPFAKETFNIGLELPGTPENQAMWGAAPTMSPDAFRKLFMDKIDAVIEEDKKTLEELMK